MSTRLSELCKLYKAQTDIKAYIKDVNLFNIYINGLGKGDNLIEIDKCDLTKSVIYYNTHNKMGTKNTLERYIQAIKHFYKFLVDKKLQEDLFAKSHITSTGDYIEELLSLPETNFKPISGREPFSKEIIITILKKLDDYDFNTFMGKNKREYEWYYNYKMLRIFVKIMLIAPVKKNTITKLRLGQIDLSNRTIEINTYKFDLTNSLACDISDFLIDREKYNKDNSIDDDFLFLHKKGVNKVNDGKVNNWIGRFLNEQGIIEIPRNKKGVYSCPIEPIMNRALLELVEQGTDYKIIAKLNNCNVSTIAALDEKYSLQSIDYKSISSRINSEIRKNFYYKYI